MGLGIQFDYTSYRKPRRLTDTQRENVRLRMNSPNNYYSYVNSIVNSNYNLYNNS